MIVLNTSPSKLFKIIPRTQVVGTVYYTLKDEQLATSIEGTATSTTDRYYSQIDCTLNLLEGRYYMMDFYSDSMRTTLIHRVKIFCTDQDKNEYNMLDGDYTQRTTTNDYIIQ